MKNYIMELNDIVYNLFPDHDDQQADNERKQVLVKKLRMLQRRRGRKTGSGQDALIDSLIKQAERKP